MRAKLIISYNGSLYSGSQFQTHTKNTISNTLITALRRLNIEQTPVASGRTDSGVHALRQVLHLDLPPFWSDLDRLKEMLNLQLPPSIRVNKIEKADDNFHARFDAKSRLYRYVVKTTEPNAFEESFVTFIDNIDIDAISEAIRLFKGRHDFIYFHKSGNDNTTTTREILSASIYRYRDYYIFRFLGSGFLRSQIRMMVAALLAISDKKLSSSQLKEQIDGIKQHTTAIAPANGLYLSRINY